MAKDALQRSLVERGARRLAARLPDPAKAALRRMRAAWQRPSPVAAPGSVDTVASPPQIVDPDSDGRNYRTPVDLAVTPTPIKRVLVIGSCFMGFLAHLMQHSDTPCEGDLLLFNHIAELPDAPPHELESYDFQVVQMPLRNIMWEHEYFHLPYDDPAAWEKFFADCCERLALYLRAAMRYNEASGLLTFVVNYVVPQQDPMGRFLPKKDLRNLIHFVDRINDELAAEAARYRNTYLVDVDQVAASFGRKYIQDDAIWHISHNSMMADFDHEYDQARIQPPRPLDQHYTTRTDDFQQAVWTELVSMYRTLKQIDSVKLVVVDLDDTLWRGVVVEESEVTDYTTEGWPLGIAEALNFLRKRGILLAIVSKNDEAKIEALWPRIFRGRLHLEDFAARKINWDAKVDNLAELLTEVNLLPRNVVYIDDNPVERAAVKAAFPDIRVLGADLYYLRRVLLWSAETQVPVITEESARRTAMVRAQVDRESLRSQVSREEFLAGLGVKVRMLEIRDVGHPRFARALELVNKTNQFNTTGRRRTLEECAELFGGGGYFTAFEVEDSFTTYGLVGVVIQARGEAELRIEQFVMSCRIFGLDVETAVLGELMREAEPAGLHRVTGTITVTDANAPCRDVFRRSGFSEGPDGTWSWEPGGDAAPAPAHVTVTV
jgi:FkbH-like protein